MAAYPATVVAYPATVVAYPATACPAMACQATACQATACPTARRRMADLRASALRMVGIQMAACPTGPCRTAAPRPAACLTAAPRTASPCPAAPCPVAGRPRAGRSMAGRRTTGRSMAGRCQVGSTGCRTGAGCRRARTAFTDRRDPPRRAGHQGGTTVLVRPRRIRTPIAGAGRLRRRAGRCQAAPFRQDRLLVRRTGVRSPPPLPRYPGYLGLRRRASTRRPDRASMLLTAGIGSARRPNHRGR